MKEMFSIENWKNVFRFVKKESLLYSKCELKIRREK